MARAASLLWLTLCLAPVAAQAANECQLRQEASLDITTESDGSISVPMSINGHDGLMLVDTGSIQSSIAAPLARELSMPATTSAMPYILMGGISMNAAVTADTVKIGTMVAKNMPLLVLPPKVLHSDTIGMLGPDIMQNYDVEIDFAAAKFNLFSPERCAGRAVYWTQAPYATIPLTLDRVGHVLIQVTLDGKPVTAVVDTGASRSVMPFSMLQSVFGIAANDPNLKKVSVTSINGTVPTAIYHYPFASLQVEGVQVTTPEIEIPTGERFNAGGQQMVLGITALRQLHLYIAYSEKAIYATPAEAR